jgi:hypothetical protein
LKTSLGEKSLGNFISKKNPSQKRACGVAQGVGPEFKHQYRKKKKNSNNNNNNHHPNLRSLVTTANNDVPIHNGTSNLNSNP